MGYAGNYNINKCNNYICICCLFDPPHPNKVHKAARNSGFSIVYPMPKSKPQNMKSNLYRLYDGDGLYLHITPSGGKWWRFKYRFNRKQKSLALGTYPEAELEDARSKRDVAKELLSQGFDPSEIRKKEKARDKAEYLESKGMPSVRATFDGKIEYGKATTLCG